MYHVAWSFLIAGNYLARHRKRKHSELRMSIAVLT